MSRARRVVSKPTPAQKIRREDFVVSLSQKGYSAVQIAKALSISTDVVTMDRNARRAELHGVRRRGGKRESWPPDPEPIDWWSDPEPRLTAPSYEMTGPVQRIRGLHDFLRETNARSRFAFNVAEAEAAGDEAYLVGAQVAIADAIKDLQELQKIAQDGKAASEARKSEARDDLREPSTAGMFVQTANSLAQAKPLPPKGVGVVPGRMYAYMWSMWWAGKDLEDPEVLKKIASREGNPSMARIRIAAAEMKAALGPN